MSFSCFHALIRAAVASIYYVVPFKWHFIIAQVIGNSVSFALGLATTLALLGVAASFAGKAYGQIGQGLPLAASSLAIVMGLNLLEVIIFIDDDVV